MCGISIKIKNYKCFKDEAGFDDIRRVNLIIGKNNAGKSSLLDMIEFVTVGNFQYDPATWRNDKKPQIIFRSTISEDVAKRTFPSSTSGGHIGVNHGQYGLQYIGRKIIWSRIGPDYDHVQLVKCDDSGITPPLANSGDYVKKLLNNIPIPLVGKKFRRVLAERDIIPETNNGKGIVIQPNGGWDNQCNPVFYQ